MKFHKGKDQSRQGQGGESGTFCASEKSMKVRHSGGEIDVRTLNVSGILKPEYLRLLLVGILGICLLIIGNALTEPRKPADLPREGGVPDFQSYETALAREVEKVVSAIAGAGRVKASVKLETGPQTHFAMNVTKSKNSQSEVTGQGEKRDTVNENETAQPVMSRSGTSGESPVLEKVTAPKVAGCVVVAEGARSPEVKENIYRAVQVLLNLPIYKIEVLPMQGGK
ncbi:MAG: hypothetical protein IMF26_02340 [Candidatus Fermentithermobacillus carboniphilus]|uniref:Stage III sporulation protein AG n=1 Tax=Candidatus Fermentithermobacillus carboniphilus TaxID=3085328 RepID=A0AAT9LFD4_9FIRM|nr:MAG: hypothetical protein IMF26_02340 [Candidatus Fermentithermobacillus carboniphilus]